MQAGDLDAKLPPVSRLGQGDMANMKFRVERFVTNPVRKISVKGNLYNPLTQVRCEMGSFLYRLNNALEANNTLRRC